MTQRGPRAWFVFGSCLVLVGLALGWVTRDVLALEKREAKAREDARVQQAVGLALWRMDSAFAPVLAQEAMRASGSEAVLTPGAGGADEAPPPAFRATFTIDAAGRPSSPEVAPYAPRLKPAPLPPAPGAPAAPAAPPPVLVPSRSFAESAPAPVRAIAPAKKPEDKSRLGARGTGAKKRDVDGGLLGGGGGGGGEKSADTERRAAKGRVDDPKPGYAAKGRDAPEHEDDAKRGDVDKSSDSEKLKWDGRGKDARPLDAVEEKLATKNETARDAKPESRPAWRDGDRGASKLPSPPMPPPPAEVAKQKEPVDVDEQAEAPAAQAKAPASTPELRGQTVAPQVELQKDEYQSRAKMAQQFQSNAVQTLQVGMIADPATEIIGGMGFAVTETGPLEPRWVSGPEGSPELFFVRRIRDKATGAESTQGLWCDWPKLERWLVSFTRDLFVDARLQPAPGGGDPVPFQLATIPAWLAPPYGLTASQEASSPTRLVLAAAWIAALGAIAAVGGVLKAALSLGERRGRFVSAVTHELRTPLTTFRMYSQMLAEGMVPPESRGEYLATLRDESERLTRVVESVLLYSRLEEGRGGAHRERIGARALIDRILPALSKRAADGGMALATVIEVDPSAAAELDVQAVEQIVLNLVDNACKYAAPASDRLDLGFRTAGAALEVRCRDWGPGIPADEREAVFLPFRRGAKDAAGTTPGVGLGLALARGLARALGGDLKLDPASEPGACFDLTIPLLRA